MPPILRSESKHKLYLIQPTTFVNVKRLGKHKHFTQFNIDDFLQYRYNCRVVFKKEMFYDLTAYRLGRFYDAINLAVYFFSLPEIYIDSAQSTMQNKFKEIANKDKPKFCLLTHYHEDHSGNAYLLQSQFKTKIVTHRKSANHLEKEFKMLSYEKIIWGKLHPLKPDLFYDENRYFETSKYKFKVIHTPGHSEDSVCLLEVNRGWIFTGDLFISQKPKYLRREENIYQILNSLKLISKADFEVLFCAHKGIVKDSPKRLVNEKIENIEKIIYETKRLYKKGLSPKKIRNILLGREDLTSFLTFFDFCKINLIESILKKEPNL